MNAYILASILLASGARAADAPPPEVKPASTIVSAEASIKEFESCVDDLEYCTSDLNKKGAELDREFKGKVPAAFSTLMDRKRGRVSRRQEACGKLAKRGDEPLRAAEAELNLITGDSGLYTTRRKAVDELRVRLNKAFKRLSLASR